MKGGVRGKKDKILELAVLDEEVVQLNSAALRKLDFTLKFFMHRRGGLIEQFDKPTVYILEFLEKDKMIDGFSYVIDINKVEILRKRTDAKKPCNDNSIDADQLYRTAVVEKAGCVPTYRKLVFIKSFPTEKTLVAAYQLGLV